MLQSFQPYKPKIRIANLPSAAFNKNAIKGELSGS